MSSGTSAEERPEEETNDTPLVGTRRKDGAILCKQRMEEGGRCGKLLAKPDGDLVCANGHTVSLEQVRDALLMDPQADVSRLMLFQVQEEATWRAILKRVTSNEFAPKELMSLNNRFLFAPTVFPSLLAQADRLDPKAAADLRAYWEINLNAVCPEVWKWIAEAGSTQNRLLRREKAIAAWSYWDNPSLPGLLIKHGLLQQVAHDRRTPEAEPEIDTFNEIIMAMEDPKRTALVFRSRGLEDRVEFDLRVDPEGVSQEFGQWRNSRVTFHSQIAFSFCPEPMVLSVIPRDDPKAIAWFHHHMKNVQPTRSEEVTFESKASLFTCTLRNPPKNRTPSPAYGLGYQVIRAFVETYGLRRRPDWG
jgi:hypothetical protein